jgi:hypothetical protein
MIGSITSLAPSRSSSSRTICANFFTLRHINGANV